jgi:hypothetical protein
VSTGGQAGVVIPDQHRHLATGVTDQGPLYGDLGLALMVILCTLVGMIVLLTLMAFLEPRNTGATGPHES